MQAQIQSDIDTHLSRMENDVITEYIKRADRISLSLRQSLNLPMSHEDDILQAGRLGLIEALHRAKEVSKPCLDKYCSIRVRGSVMDWVRTNGYYSSKAYKKVKAVVEQSACPVKPVEYLQDPSVLEDAGNSSIEKHYESRRLFAVLNELLSALPEKEKKIIEQHYFRDQPLSKMAAPGQKLPSLSKKHRNALRILKNELLAKQLTFDSLL